MLAACSQLLDKLDACFLFNCEIGTQNFLVKISFEKAHISLDYLYNSVTKDTAELRKLSKMPKATFYQNLRKLTQQGTIKRKHGSGRPRAFNQNDEKTVCRKALRSPLKSSWQITREVQTSRSINVSKSTVYWTSRKAKQKSRLSFRNR